MRPTLVWNFRGRPNVIVAALAKCCFRFSLRAPCPACPAACPTPAEVPACIAAAAAVGSRAAHFGHAAVVAEHIIGVVAAADQIPAVAEDPGLAAERVFVVAAACVARMEFEGT